MSRGWPVLAATIFALACDRAATSDFTGRWVYEENGESVELLLEHDTAKGTVSGTFVALGKRAVVSGHADASAILIEKVGGVASSAVNGTMVGAVSGEQMLLTITQPGQDPVILRLARQSGSGPRSAGPASSGASTAKSEGTASRTTPTDVESFTPSEPEAFTGSWEAVSDDGTNVETAEFQLSDGVVTGSVRSLERGYYSKRVTVSAELAVRGTPQAGGLDIRAWEAQSTNPEAAVTGRAVRRGDYLILQLGEGETGYARPGVPIVQSAEGSAGAAALAQSITGRVYSASTQASGRGGFVGKRVRLALCADGNIEFDVSDLASAGGVDLGDATSRRGQWEVVLLAGTPVVRAHWRGTGSSYSLTRYFRVRPHADGAGARVDGTELPVAGSC